MVMHFKKMSAPDFLPVILRPIFFFFFFLQKCISMRHFEMNSSLTRHYKAPSVIFCFAASFLEVLSFSCIMVFHCNRKI